jgi:hypothetical protein
MLLNTVYDSVVYVPRAERVSFDMLVRYRHEGYRGTTLLKNLTCGGARIEGLEGLRAGDKVTLYLPSLAPKDATVAWATQNSFGLEFDRPLHPDIFEDLVMHHCTRRDRTDTDRATQIDNRYDRPAH